MTTTVKQLIEYLETLPEETEVSVVETAQGGFAGDYSYFADLDIGDHCEFTDFTGNKFVKKTEPHYNKKTLDIGTI